VCPIINYYALWGFIVKYKLIFGIILLIVGLYMCFFGAYFLYVIIFFIGIISWLLIGIIFIFDIFGSFTIGVTDIQMIIILSTSAFLGILYGVLMVKFQVIFHITSGIINV